MLRLVGARTLSVLVPKRHQRLIHSVPLEASTRVDSQQLAWALAFFELLVVLGVKKAGPSDRSLPGLAKPSKAKANWHELADSALSRKHLKFSFEKT